MLYIWLPISVRQYQISVLYRFQIVISHLYLIPPLRVTAGNPNEFDKIFGVTNTAVLLETVCYRRTFLRRCISSECDVPYRCAANRRQVETNNADVTSQNERTSRGTAGTHATVDSSRAQWTSPGKPQPCTALYAQDAVISKTAQNSVHTTQLSFAQAQSMFDVRGCLPHRYNRKVTRT